MYPMEKCDIMKTEEIKSIVDEASWKTVYGAYIKTDDGPVSVSVSRNADVVTLEFDCNKNSYVINVTDPKDIRTLVNLLQRTVPIETIEADMDARLPAAFD